MHVICYVDGFNLYHGLRSKGWKKYYWLDLWKLTEHYLLPNQYLRELVYCTSRVRRNPEGLSRQLKYIDAITALRKDTKVVYGNYLVQQVRCPNCGYTRLRHEEKMTDVNIACQLLADAMDERFDTAFVISGDSDLAPPIKMIKERFPMKRILSVFPPNRISKALSRTSHGVVTMNESDVRRSQLPEMIETGDRVYIRRPSRWK